MRAGDEHRVLAEIARNVEREDPRMARILRHPPWWWRLRPRHVVLGASVTVLWLAVTVTLGILSVSGP